jgi:hypothetical protein
VPPHTVEEGDTAPGLSRGRRHRAPWRKEAPRQAKARAATTFAPERERETEEPVVACGEDKNAYSTTLDERERERGKKRLDEIRHTIRV